MGIPPVAVTRHQEILVSATLAMLDKTLVRLGRHPAKIGRERIHFLNEEDYRGLSQATVWEQTWGFSAYGRIYLRASKNRRASRLVANLTHELAHVAGQNGLVVTAGGRNVISTFNGLCASAFLNDISLDGFRGWNEVATEFFAHDLRLGLISEGLVAKSDAAWLKDHWRYGTIVGDLANSVLGRLQGEGEDIRGFTRLVILDYLTGTIDSFAVLSRHQLSDIESVEASDDSVSRFLGKLLIGHEC